MRLDGKKLRRSFPTIAAARAWQRDTERSVARHELRAPTPLTFNEAADEWLRDAEAGIARTRSGSPFKPSATRSYRASLILHVLPRLGRRRLTEITRADLQDIADRMLASGASASTTRNAIIPVRTIMRRAITRGLIGVNPASGLTLPASNGRRDRVADPQEMAALLELLAEGDRAVWACAAYAGLRAGELQALSWADVDLDERVLHVRHGWDRLHGLIVPKSLAGVRSVPIPDVLRRYLLEHRLRTGRSVGFVFGRSEDRPFVPSAITARARRTWSGAGVEPIGLHACRHSFVSHCIAAGLDVKAISVSLGHVSLAFTLDRYAHVFADHESRSAALLDRYFAQRAQKDSANRS